MTGNDFHQQELTYWRNRALWAEARLDSIRDVFNDLMPSHVPPEPPVGTTYHHITGAMIWEHRADGWHCRHPECTLCPRIWGDVFDLVSIATALRILPDEPGWFWTADGQRVRNRHPRELGEPAANTTLDELSAAAMRGDTDQGATS